MLTVWVGRVIVALGPRTMKVSSNSLIKACTWAMSVKLFRL